MPVLQIYSPLDAPPPGLLDEICSGIIDILRLPPDHCWAIWNEVAPNNFHRASWHYGATENGPIVIIYCKSTYGDEEIAQLLVFVRDTLARKLFCSVADVYATIQRVQPGETLVRGGVWQLNDGGTVTEQNFNIRPVGIVRSPRAAAEDDYWGDIDLTIELDARRFGADALLGLADFSHVEVIFLMNQVDLAKVETGARHPRERVEWPLVGIFAQRGKSRPNRIGVSRCEVLNVSGTILSVRGLDAIDGTPVIDIKPYMLEFAPRGALKQPDWSHEVMKSYYKNAAERE